MTLRAVSPAPLPDVLALYQATAPMKPVTASAAILQAARSDTIGWFAGDQMIAAALFYPLDPERPGEDLRELAFVCLPALSGHLPAFIRSARLTRARLGEDALVRIRAHVRLGHLPGQKLARLCGMVAVSVVGDFERWETEGT
jgi:hypothetical protein